MSRELPVHVLVMAKAPAPGKVKTRLCPPCTWEEAADIAEAALVDTLTAVASCSGVRRVIALDGAAGDWLPPGFHVVPQVDGAFAERLGAAWAVAGAPGIQIGMDTPQITGELLESVLARLHRPTVDAVLGLAEDGGWWVIGFRRPQLGAFRGVPMSTRQTGIKQLERLESLGLRVALAPTLRDLDTIEDATYLAAELPQSRTAASVRRVMTAMLQ